VGPDLIGQNQDLLSRTIQGDFLDPATNPFLQQTFDTAADSVTRRLQSDFAGAGRNLGAGAPAASEQFQNLAGQIFGGNFQAERDRQISAGLSSLDFDPLNLLINRLGGIIPGAGGTTTSQQPVFRQGLFSDRRLKENIRQIGTKADYPWYSFTYVWGEDAEGFMSDEIPQEYVFKRGKWDCVDYEAMGVRHG